MSDRIIMYDETEQTTTRYVGFVGDSNRFDLMITITEHFFGKQVVTCLQTGRSAIVDQNEVQDATYLKEAFQLASDQDAEELSAFLSANIV